MVETAFIVTCEHASGLLPNNYKDVLLPYVEGQEKHRIYDEGALPIAYALFDALTPSALFQGQYSRLYVDLNRSKTHRSIFGLPISRLPQAEKTAILTEDYEPYRGRVESAISAALSMEKRVLHLSVHSFTPELSGKRREAEFGLLYDPARSLEVSFCRQWLFEMRKVFPDWRCRANYPYKGISDGFTKSLRKQFKENYLGIELEFNQHLPLEREAKNYAITISHILQRILCNV